MGFKDKIATVIHCDIILKEPGTFKSRETRLRKARPMSDAERLILRGVYVHGWRIGQTQIRIEVVSESGLRQIKTMKQSEGGVQGTSFAMGSQYAPK